MLTFFLASTVFTALITSTSALSNTSFLLHEQRDTHPDSFSSQGPAPSDTVIYLQVALMQRDIVGLQNKLLNVSTPGSAEYGHYLSKEQVVAYIAPETSTVTAVQNWLKESNVTSAQTSPAGDWISFSTNVEQANALLDANYTTFVNKQTGKAMVRTLSYSLPAYLKGHVELVHPTISFPGSHQDLTVGALPQQDTPPGTAPASCDQGITPTCLQRRYNIPATVNATQKANRIVITSQGSRPANKTELEMFLSAYRQDVPSSTTFTSQNLDGDTIPSSMDEDDYQEANIDAQYTIGLATGVPVSFMHVGDDHQDGGAYGWLDVVQTLVAEESPPTVWTTSYGIAESDISTLLAVRICNAYASLGARGTSVLFASGDGGISGPQPDSSCTKFAPTFPSGCPYVTSVGATQHVDPEEAASLSSGGFSNIFSPLLYQKAATARYLSFVGPSANAGWYNASGRGYPDVAAIGQNVEFIADGKSMTANGTSFSSPIFASIIALLNDELMTAGKPPLGFLNPWLYLSAATALNDITTGKNPGCDTNGFYTMPAWDPVTGLGSADYVRLRAAAGLS